MAKLANSTLETRTSLRRTPFKRRVSLRTRPTYMIAKGSGSPKKAPRTRGLAKVRKDTIGKLKIKLWAVTRQIIIKRYGSDCYTCPATNLVGSNRHVGHFISSSVCSSELRYDLENLRPQCYACNIHRSGNWPEYERHLIRDGIDVEELKRRNEQTKGMKADILFYQAKIAEYECLLFNNL